MKWTSISSANRSTDRLSSLWAGASRPFSLPCACTIATRCMERTQVCPRAGLGHPVGRGAPGRLEDRRLGHWAAGSGACPGILRCDRETAHGVKPPGDSEDQVGVLEASRIPPSVLQRRHLLRGSRSPDSERRRVLGASETEGDRLVKRSDARRNAPGSCSRTPRLSDTESRNLLAVPTGVEPVSPG